MGVATIEATEAAKYWRLQAEQAWDLVFLYTQMLLCWHNFKQSKLVF